jgi:AcrR family transcriptional regulator
MSDLTEPKARRKRSDSAVTEARLMRVAERLFAHRGLAGVSLSEIGSAAGQANKTVVSYHFGDKEDLARRIFDARFAQLEAWRGAGLARAKQAGTENDLRTLVELFFRAPAEIEENGERIFARFLLQFLVQFESWGGVRHPLATIRDGPSAEIFDRIDALIGANAMAKLSARASCLLLGSVLEWENRAALGGKQAGLETTITQSLDMIADAFEGYRRR